MTEKAHRDKITERTKSLGTYRPEFTRTRTRLAQIYVRIEQLTRALEDGDFATTQVTQTKSGEMVTIDPHITELDRLNDQALAYEKALGLTADSARKLREDIFAPQQEDTLAKALRVMRCV